MTNNSYFKDVIISSVDKVDVRDFVCEYCEGIIKTYAGNSACVLYFRNETPLPSYEENVKKCRNIGKRFLSCVNALLNSGGGMIVLHIDEAFLGIFDEQMDDKLMKLVQEETFFDEHFERHPDEYGHMKFRVKPSKRSKPSELSTLKFKSKLYLKKGLIDPTQSQMKCLLKRDRNEDSDQEENQRLPENYFQKGTVITFPWNFDMQAKDINEKEFAKLKGRNVAEKIRSYLWNKIKLPKLITALSKQPKGGSFFLGLQEMEEDKRPKWQLMEEMNGVAEIFDTQRQFWIDDKNDKVFHVGTMRDVPSITVRTGSYVCNGIDMSRNDLEPFRRMFMQQVNQTMKWYNTSANEHVQVIFHEMSPTGNQNNNNSTYVLEIRVKPILGRGACFATNNGPIAFMGIPPICPSKIQEIKWESWIKNQ